MSEPEELVYVNGINGRTGAYLFEPMPVRALAGHAMSALHKMQNEEKEDLNQKANPEISYAPPPWTDDQDLSQVGWGVLFAAGADPKVNAAIREALSELLDWRKQQAGALYQEFIEGRGVRPTDTKRKFLNRYGAGDGTVRPDAMPYYLLIVGDPQSIDYTFQYELDLAYAVGRIHFPTLDEYARYARSVVTAEKAAAALAPQAAFFSMVNPNDPATTASNDQFARPLYAKMSAMPQLIQQGWKFSWTGDGQATKKKLARLMGGDQTPALLFTTSHGMAYPVEQGCPEQIPYSGALMCEKWPGKDYTGDVPVDWLFSADNIPDSASLLGSISFNFACYGAGSPYLDDYFRRDGIARAPVAPYAFLSRLPQRMLAHPNGGALAMIGHVERAWGNSIAWGGVDQTTSAQSVIYSLLAGKRVGSAVDYLNQRYAEIGTQLTNKFERGQLADDRALVSEWTTFNDARGYIVIGDPAARLNIDPAAASQRAGLGEIAARPGRVPYVLVSAKAPAGAQVDPPPAPAFAPRPAPAATGGGSMTPAASPQPSVPISAPLRDTAYTPERAATLNQQLAGTLQAITTRLAQFAQNMSTLEVSTYTCDQLEAVVIDPATGSPVSGARQAALTRLSLDGDLKVYIPTQAGEVDRAVWDIHLQMVDLAQAHRNAMIKTTLEALTRLLNGS